MKTAIALLVFLSFLPETYADLGGCLVYKAKYVLKNGQTVTGYLPLCGYGDYSYLNDATGSNAYCSDKEFQKLINRVFYKERHTLWFTVYKQINMVDPGDPARPGAYSGSFKIAFTDSSSLVRLNLDSIRYTVFFNAKPGEWSYPETGIQVVDDRTAGMMREQAVFNATGIFKEPVLEQPGSKYYHEFDEYLVLNYDRELSHEALQKKMEKVAREIYAPEEKYLRSKAKNRLEVYEREKETVIQPLIDTLRREKIILVFVQQTC